MADEWTPEHMRQVFESVKNWGRWGEDDERGALNLITPEKRREGAAAVIAGETIICALELAVLRLDDLAEACARHGRWAFQFTVAPLRIDKATGSPVNPIAVV